MRGQTGNRSCILGNARPRKAGDQHGLSLFPARGEVRRCRRHRRGDGGEFFTDPGAMDLSPMVQDDLRCLADADLLAGRVQAEPAASHSIGPVHRPTAVSADRLTEETRHAAPNPPPDGVCMTKTSPG